MLSNMNTSLASNVIFLFDDISSIDIVEKYNKKYNIFKTINKGIASQYELFIKDVNDLKIASFNKNDINNIKKGTSLFFNNHIDSLLNSFLIKIVPLEKDFLCFQVILHYWKIAVILNMI